DILDISKIQSGKFTLEKRDVQLDEIQTACLASFRLLAEETRVSLESNIESVMPSIRADGVKLRQIFTNLISNAIKFTPEGGKVSVEARELPDGRIGVLVSDTGVGMTEQELQIALTPFGQVDGSRTRWREGTGLGLPIAKSLVELHGGELKVTSAKNKGTEIWVLLPPPDLIPITEARDRILGQPMAVADPVSRTTEVRP
ncbi:MAG: sensor histidine kinase, partial [Hyphomicrobiaceae bacterium]|nr:sensor histidine kinase [Hyphomicrobiaceae bacterium]